MEIKLASKIGYGFAGLFIAITIIFSYSHWWVQAFYQHNANMNAKILCSALYVSGRDVQEALAHSIIWDTVPVGMLSLPEVQMNINAESKSTAFTLSVPPLFIDIQSKTARYYDDQGCVLNADDGTIHFQPTAISSSLAPADTMEWPMGDLNAGPDYEQREAIDYRKLGQALNLIFSAEKEMTVAFLVLHKGKIIVESYADEVTGSMPLESWSMGKSIASTLIGRLIYLEHLSLEQPAPIPAWQDDDKGQITVRNLLTMSSGIEFERALFWNKPVRDHFHVYSGGMNTVAFINNKPLQHPPDTVGRYRNSDPISLMNILRLKLSEAGEDYLSWPQLQLFDKIGARHFMLEPDPYGTFLISGYDYGVARDWARLGLLYLQDGVWLGERLLPEGYTRFVSTEAPAWTGESPSYGGMFWINRGPHFESLPEQSYFMAGAGGQHVWIVPDHDLVMVRMGHRRGGFQNSLHETLNKTHALVLEAIQSPDNKKLN